MKLTEKELARFWAKVDRNGPLPPAYTGLRTPCALWMGAKGKRARGGGYGNLTLRKNSMTAHRVAWIIANGCAIPSGHIICHRCDNPACVNGEHLFAGEHRDNIDDKVQKGRQLSHERHPLASLTAADVTSIRSLYGSGGWTQEGLGKKFGVSQAQVGHIINGKSWRIPTIVQ